MSEETKACSRCGKLMIRRATGITYLTYPPMFPMEWWCGCGHREAADIVHGFSEAQLALKRWKEVNESKQEERHE